MEINKDITIMEMLIIQMIKEAIRITQMIKEAILIIPKSLQVPLSEVLLF